MSKKKSNIFLDVYCFLRRAGLLRGHWYHPLYRRAYFFYKRYYEDPFHGFVRQNHAFISSGNIFDIGANIGYTTTTFARALKDGYRVYAFEPDSTNYALLQRAVSRSGLSSKVVAVRSAVGNHEGEVRFWRNDLDPADHRVATEHFGQDADPSKVTSVPICSLDSFVAKLGSQVPISLIKIDVQGYELAVCQGMTNTLAANNSTAVVLEYMPSVMEELGYKPKELFRFFEERGFKMYHLTKKGAISPISVKEIDTLCADRGYIDLLFRH